MDNCYREHQADLTAAVRRHETRIPYGVVDTEGVAVTGLPEKPVTRHLINAGIYLLDPDVCQHIPATQPYNMPDLIVGLLTRGRRVIGFPVRGY